MTEDWSGRRGSNPQPTAWEAATLPLSYSRSLTASILRPLGHSLLLRFRFVRLGCLALLFAAIAPGQVGSINLQPYGFKPTTNAAYRPEFNTSAVAYLTDGSLVVAFRRVAEIMEKSPAQGRHNMPIRLLRFDARSGKLLAQADAEVVRGMSASFLASAPDSDLLLLGPAKFTLLNSELRTIGVLGFPARTTRIDLSAGASFIAAGVRDGTRERFGVISVPSFTLVKNFELPAALPIVILSDGYASIRYGQGGTLELLLETDKERTARVAANSLDCRSVFGVLPQNHVAVVGCHHFWIYDEHAERVLKGDIGFDDDLVGIASSSGSPRFAFITIEGFSGAPMDQQRIYADSLRAIVYDLSTRSKVRTIKIKPMPKLGGAFALSPDGKTIAVLKDGEVDQISLQQTDRK